MTSAKELYKLQRTSHGQTVVSVATVCQSEDGLREGAGTLKLRLEDCGAGGSVGARRAERQSLKRSFSTALSQAWGCDLRAGGFQLRRIRTPRSAAC